MYLSPNHRLRWGMTVPLALAPLVAVVALAVFLAWSGGQFLGQLSLAALVDVAWQSTREVFGLSLLFLGTVASTMLALGLAVPIGLAASLYLALYASPFHRTLADAAIALLGGIPSVVIGLWSMVWIVPLAGHSLATATLVLTLMITPTFTLLSGAALRQVPADLVEAVRALGVNEWGIAWVVLRQARGVAGRRNIGGGTRAR